MLECRLSGPVRVFISDDAWTTRRSATSSAFRTDTHRRALLRRVRKQPLWSQSRRLGAVALVSGADERLAARDPAASVARLVTAQCALDCSLLEWRFGRRARARRRGESARSARRHAIKMKIKMKGAADQNENGDQNEVFSF